MSSVSSYTPRAMRISLFNVLYAAQAGNYESSIASIADNLRRGLDEPLEIVDAALVPAQEIVDMRQELDDTIRPLLDNWRLERLSVSTHLILQIAFWEFLKTDTDRIVIINEAIELAKLFAEDDAHKFINGVLDRWIKLQQFQAA